MLNFQVIPKSMGLQSVGLQSVGLKCMLRVKHASNYTAKWKQAHRSFEHMYNQKHTVFWWIESSSKQAIITNM